MKIDRLLLALASLAVALVALAGGAVAGTGADLCDRIERARYQSRRATRHGRQPLDSGRCRNSRRPSLRQDADRQGSLQRPRRRPRQGTRHQRGRGWLAQEHHADRRGDRSNAGRNAQRRCAGQAAFDARASPGPMCQPRSMASVCVGKDAKLQLARAPVPVAQRVAVVDLDSAARGEAEWP